MSTASANAIRTIIEAGANERRNRRSNDTVPGDDVREQIIPVLASVGLRLSEEKTTIASLDEGFEFLGFRIQRQTKRGSNHRFVYTWISRRSLTSIKSKVKAITRQGTNNPCRTCCASSIPCCAAGPTTSNTLSRSRHSVICRNTPGDE